MGCPSSTLRATRTQSRELVQVVEASVLLRRVAGSVEAAPFPAKRTQSTDARATVQGFDANHRLAKSTGVDDVHPEQPLLSDRASQAEGQDASEEEISEVDVEVRVRVAPKDSPAVDLDAEMEQTFRQNVLDEGGEQGCTWRCGAWMRELWEAWGRLWVCQWRRGAWMGAWMAVSEEDGEDAELEEKLRQKILREGIEHGCSWSCSSCCYKRCGAGIDGRWEAWNGPWSCQWRRGAEMVAWMEVFMRLKPVLILKITSGMIFRALDTGLDFRTAVRFYEQGEVRWASLTLTFILVSPMIHCFFVYFRTKECRLALPFSIPGSVQHLRREWRQVQLVTALPQSGLFQNIHIQAGACHLNEVLAGIECLFESLPQACIQGYAYKVEGNADYLNYASLSLSLLGVAAGVISGVKALGKGGVETTAGKSYLFESGKMTVALASSSGDTLAMHSMHLSDTVVQALVSYLQGDSFIAICDLSSTNSTDQKVCAMIGACKNLKEVNLRNCCQVTDKGVSKLAANCPGLNKVHLGGCRQVTDAGVSKLAANCPELKEVGLFLCDQVTDEGVSKLAANCPELKEVDLSHCRQVTDEGVSELAANCPGLKEVNLHDCQVTDAGVSKLAANCPELKEVNLSFCRQVTDEGVSKLAANCPELNKVDLVGCQVTDAGVSKLAANCPGLNKVDLSHCRQVTDEGVSELAANCPELKEVNLSFCGQVTDEGVSELAANCPELKEVNLGGCRQVTDAGVSKLAANCPELNKVDLSFCRQVTDEGVSELAANCPGLKEVNIHDCQVTDEGVSELAANCPGLKEVDLSFCDQVTDEGVSELAANCPGLKEVNLHGCQVTDEGLSKLAANCPGLSKR